MSADFKKAVAAYLKAVNTMQAGKAVEHTYRIAFAAFLQSLDGSLKLRNDPGKVGKGGNPDFLVERGETEVGIIETKDIGADLDAIESSKQMARYLEHYPNLLLTDYIQFRWYHKGQPRLQAALARPGKEGRWSIVPDNELKKAGQLLDAFLNAETEFKGAADDLATRMARIARELRDRIRDELRDGNEFLDAKLQRFREELIHDMDAAEFADMYAQTVAYGLFTARYYHGGDGGFGLGAAASDIPVTSPFLRNLFNEIATINLPASLREPVQDLIALLKNADLALRSHFGEGTGLGDPVIHFYETFLKEYDPKLRELRGVYYTPDPVVDYIVRSVDSLLRSKFGFKDGLASNQRIKHPKPAKDRPGDIHELLILDPATGTGTFLHHVIREIHKSRLAANAGLWDGYVAHDLLPRLHGFEFLMAPYAIAHLKLGLLLKELGYKFASDARLRVFLTNTLEEAKEGKKSLYADQFLEMESRLAQIIKREDPVMVILGNPPYSGHSANNGEWIAKLLKGVDSLTETPTSNYFEVDGKPLGERNPKWLNDDYVKFIRWAQWRIERTGSGILAFVTNHGYLDNPTFRGMRQSLLDAFDEIYILDLHGNSKKKEKAPGGGKDENVFDIQQGVAIGIFVKRNASTSSAGFQPALSGQSSAGFQPAHSEQGRQDGGATGGGRRGTIMRLRKGLPHLETDDGTYFVTFRLSDSLPVAVVEEYKFERKNILKTASQQKRDLTTDEQRRLSRLFSEKVESLLDSAEGECWLARPGIASVVDDALRHFDGQRYRLLAHCVMPNHVHVVFTPLNGHKLDDILHSWKSFTANEANSKLGRKGAFWQREYYDHLVRDQADLDRVIQYTLDNPVKARLKDWKWCSAGFQPALSESQQDAGATESGQGRQDGGATASEQGRLEAGATRRATVFHAHLWGDREEKYRNLLEQSVESTKWTPLDPQPPFYLFVPQDTTHFEEYQKGFKLTEAMPVNSVGIVTARDSLTIHWTEKDAWKTVQDFAKLTPEAARAKYELGKDARDWKVELAQKDLKDTGINRQRIVPISYRPFDTRHTYFTGNSRGFQCMPRGEVMRHMVGGGNRALHTCRQVISEKWCHSFATAFITDDSHVSNVTRERGYLFPLYLHPDGEASQREANFSPAFLKAIEARKLDSKPETVFNYIYAVLHSPTYRHRYAEYLKMDFPRVPLTSKKKLFDKLALLGGELVGLHLCGEDLPRGCEYPVDGDNEVEKPVWEAGRVWINKSQYFDGIEKSVWEFQVGGYMPAQKWLKDRKGRVLGHEELTHYPRMIHAMRETIRLMAATDKAIDAHGGWPVE